MTSTSGISGGSKLGAARPMISVSVRVVITWTSPLAA